MFARCTLAWPDLNYRLLRTNCHYFFPSGCNRWTGKRSRSFHNRKETPEALPVPELRRFVWNRGLRKLSGFTRSGDGKREEKAKRCRSGWCLMAKSSRDFASDYPSARRGTSRVPILGRGIRACPKRTGTTANAFPVPCPGWQMSRTRGMEREPHKGRS